MGFFKTLFTGKEETEEEKNEQQRKNQFDVFKYDGIQAMRIGRVDYAAECFRRALDLQDDVETRVHYANLLMSHNNPEEAIVQLLHVLEQQPGNLQLMVTLAELYFQTENYELMKTVCDTLIEAAPSLPTPYYLLAKMYKAQDDPIQAVAQATLAISHQEDEPFVEAYYLRAQVLYAMQQYAEAEADVDVILQPSDPTDDYLLLKAECCEAQNRLPEAKDYYQRVIDTNPFVAQAYLRLGSILMAEGHKDEAAEMLKEGLQLAPDAQKAINGEFTNLEEKMRDTYRSIDPFGLSGG